MEVENKEYRLLEHLPDAFAYHELMTDNNGNPVDYIFIEVNRAFEQVTGLARDKIIGKKVTEILPGIENSSFDWIGTYGRVALTGEPITFESYFEPLLRWYEVAAYSDESGFFGVVFRDRTEQKKAQETREAQLLQVNERLKQRDALLQKLSQNVPSMFYQYRLFPDGRSCFPYSSAGIRNIYEVSPEEVCRDAAKVFQRLHPDDLDAVVASIMESFHTLQQWTDEYRVLLPEKRERWIKGSATPEKLEDGSVLWYGELTDITERKRAEQALQEAYRRMDEIIECSPDATVVVDQTGTVIAWNKAMEEMTLVPKTEMLGKSNHEYAIPFYGKRRPILLDLALLSEEEFARAKEHYDHIHWSGDTLFGEVYCPETYGGKGAYLWASATRLRDAQGTIFGAIESIRDITKRKQMEAERKRLNSILEKSPDYIAITDIELQVLYLNQGGKKMLGYTDVSDFSSYQATDFRPRWANELFINEVLPAVQQQGLWSGETALLTRQGEEIPVLQVSMAHRGTGGKLEYISTIARDIRERKQAEEERIARKAAEGANWAKSEFLANMSHEIRTPMNVIIGMTDLLCNAGLPPQEQEYAAMVNESARSLLVIINDILDFSKIEAGKLELELQDFHLPREMERTIGIFALEAQAKGLELNLNLAADLPQFVRGDPARLRQILINLLGNAVKFTSHGEVSLNVATGPSLPLDSNTPDQSPGTEAVNVSFAVSDTGIGIPEDKLDRLFQSFSQVDGSFSRQFEGTGLGLAISKKLGELMGGTISVNSKAGVGSTFVLTLPLQRFAAAGTGVEQQPSHPSAATAEGTHTAPPAEEVEKPLQILLVEDKPMNRKLATTLLEKKGWSVTEAHHGQQALELLASCSFDLILMDIQMPEMDGLEATKQIRLMELMEKATVTHVPIIAMTAHAMQGDREQFLAAGMDDYISKPIEAQKLYRIVEQHLPVKQRKDSPPQQNIRPFEAATQYTNTAAPGHSVQAEALQKPGDISKILVVDDKQSHRELLKKQLVSAGYTNLLEAASGREALQKAREQEPDLVLLDIMMPGMDGYEVCQRLQEERQRKHLPVIFLSSLSDTMDKVKAFERGGVDYITKPFAFAEVIARVQTHLRMHCLQQEMEKHNIHLEQLVQEKIKEISVSQIAATYAIAHLAEKRDYETGKHLERTRQYCRLLADWLSEQPGYRDLITHDFVHCICEASPLHDIGKVGIPDTVLLKPGKLTADEFEQVKQHTTIGAETLQEVNERYPDNQFIAMGMQIARSHHERWDGKGYPDRLAGEYIPLAARIMALADVYDALRSKRPYKDALNHEKCREIISAEKEAQFDPLMVDAFLAYELEFARIHRKLEE